MQRAQIVGVKFTKWLIAAVIGLIVLATVALWERGAERKPFRIASRDGSCVMEGVLKKRWFKTGEFGWWFTDSEPEWVGAEAWIIAGSGRYPLPRYVAAQIANAGSISITSCQFEGSRLEVKLDGGESAGRTFVTFVFKQGKLTMAKAERADYP